MTRASRRTFARVLRREGFTVRTALTAESGLSEAHGCRLNAILLDLRMPVTDGLGFLRRLRAHDHPRRTPVAIITGDYFLDDRVTAEIHQLGAAITFKPLWVDDLVDLVRTLVRVTHEPATAGLTRRSGVPRWATCGHRPADT